jgi:hypothetical protein
MKLSELVAFRNNLRTMSTRQVNLNTATEIKKIVYTIKEQPVDLESDLDFLQQDHDKIIASLDQFEDDLNKIKEKIDQLINEQEKPWFAESYRLYEQEMCYDTSELILNRRPAINEESMKIFEGRISTYANWKYPAMIIRPGLEKFIGNMVAFDPLYLVDQRHELLQPSIKQFNEIYQNRLRPYVVRESLEEEILVQIPNNQFGLCLCYNFFNFKPFEIIKKYLIEIYQKLRPGGILAMTFNDCDYWQGVALVERHYSCYTPGFLVKELAISLGYEIEFSYNNNTNITWMELKKPGKLQSLRGGQTLARTVVKSK